MALGDNNTQKKDQKYEDTFYSRIKFSNKEDKLNLGFSYWKGMLKISISLEKAAYNGVTYEELVAIHLSPLKAMETAKVLRAFINSEEFDTTTLQYGINTGISETQSVIGFGNEFILDGNVRKIVHIGKVDPTGTLFDDITFGFNKDYHYNLEWTDFAKMECEKTFDNKLELEMFLSVLDQYAAGITGGISYSVMDMGRFNNTRVNNNIGQIMDALNIERKSNKSNGGDANNSFFNNNKNQGAGSQEVNNRARSNRTSIDDIGK